MNLPKKFDKLHRIVGSAYPTNYSVVYPWTHPLNQVPNCLAMLGDGFPVFKLEVINENKFKLAVLTEPWRGKDDYDFLFLDRGIKEGDTFDYVTLLGIIIESVAHINKRSPNLGFIFGK